MKSVTNQPSHDKWWFWMRNSGFSGSAPFLTLEIHRVNAIAGAEYEQMFGTTVGAFHHWKDGTSTKYFRTKDVDLFGANFLEQIVRNPEMTREWWEETERRGNKLVEIADTLSNTTLSELSSSELLQLFIATTDAYWRLGVHSSIPLFGGRALQKILEPKLYERMSELGLMQDEFGKFYTTLTTGSYVSWPKREEQALRALADEIRTGGLNVRKLPSEYQSRLEQHAKTFDWIPYKWIGPVWQLNDFQERLEQMVMAERKSSARKMTCNEAAEILRLDKYERILYDALAAMGDLKELKGNYMARGAYQLGKFRAEIVRRYGLSERVTALMLSEDYKRLLITDTIDTDAIMARQNAFLWHAEDGVEHLYTGQDALERVAQEFAWQEAAKAKTVYEGTPVFPGKVVGIARKILRYETDAPLFKKGDILIAYRTTPHYVPLMDMARGVITSEGGLTQHAAQIAREHEIPCIVGVSDIIDGVENGQPLQLDAGSGRIEKITRDAYERLYQDSTDTKQSPSMFVRRELIRIPGPEIIWLEEASHEKVDRKLIGNKAANQAIMYRGFNVPNGFIATTAFYFQFLQEVGVLDHLKELPQLIERAQADMGQLQSISQDYTLMIVNADVSGFFDSIRHAYTILGAPSTVTRSSGIDEDGKESSFAGIFETYLNHRTADQVVLGLKKCWASLFSPKALLYSARSGFDPSSNQMGVLVQDMKNGNASGVMYTGIEGHTMIEACEGVCDPLVAGRITPALYVLDADLKAVYIKKGNQKFAEYVDANGLYRERPVTNQLPLRGKELFELGMIGRKTQERFGVPQDVEWIITDVIYVTQNRDLTSKPMLPGELAK